MKAVLRAVPILLSVAIVAGFAYSRIRLTEDRGFNPDEFEHLHFSWLTSQGDVAFRDYFDHHPPLLHLVFAEWLNHGDFSDSEGPIRAIRDARSLSLICAVLALIAGGLMVGAEAGPGAALIFVALLCSSTNFIAKGLEFRPDVPALLGLTLALALHLRGRPFLAGLFGGFALMTTPKTLFPLLGLLAALLHGASTYELSRKSRLARFAAGFGVPLAGMAIWLLMKGAFPAAVRFALVEGVRYSGPPAGPFLVEFVETDAVLCSLFVGAALYGFLNRKAAGGAIATAVWMGLLGFGGLFLVPPTRHYLLLTLPACATAGALLADRLLSHLRREPVRVSACVALSAGIIVVGWPEHTRAFARGNAGAVAALRTIASNTAPNETVLDGFIGYAPLRRHGGFFPFLHRDTRPVRERTESPPLLEALRSGQNLPKFALMNHYLREGVDEEVWKFLEANYEPLDDDPEVRVRVFDNGLGFWDDAAPRGLAPDGEHRPHVMVLEGWSEPRVVDGLKGRWLIGGEPAGIVLPVRGGSGFDLVVSLRASEPFPLSAIVNGVDLGAVEVDPSTSSVRIDVPNSAWREGLNRIVLSAPLPGQRFCFVSSLELRPRPQP